MTAQYQEEILAAAQSLGAASASARAWVTKLAETATSVAAERQSLVEVTRRSENLSRVMFHVKHAATNLRNATAR